MLPMNAIELVLWIVTSDADISNCPPDWCAEIV